MTKDEKMLVKHLTAKVASEIISDAVASMYLIDDCPFEEEDIYQCGAELMKACEITGPITTTADGHIMFGNYITEKLFNSMTEVKSFIAFTAANYIDYNDII